MVLELWYRSTGSGIEHKKLVLVSLKLFYNPMIQSRYKITGFPRINCKKNGIWPNIVLIQNKYMLNAS